MEDTSSPVPWARALRVFRNQNREQRDVVRIEVCPYSLAAEDVACDRTSLHKASSLLQIRS
jgi:hypothetical protein